VTHDDNIDDCDGVLVSRFRDPPGWAAAIMRVAEVGFGAATNANDIMAHYQQLALIVVEELPDSDQRTALLSRLADLEAAALIGIGGVTVH
jgi:hypothetical protein